MWNSIDSWVVFVTRRLCSTEGDLLYSHECPSLVKITQKRSQLGSTMSKSRRHDYTVKAAAAIQDGAVLELQLNGVRALSCIPLHSSTWKINPETELAKGREHTTSEMTVWDLPCWSCGRGKCFCASLLGGLVSHRNQDRHTGRTQAEPEAAATYHVAGTAALRQWGAQHHPQISVSTCVSYNPQRILRSFYFAWQKCQTCSPFYLALHVKEACYLIWRMVPAVAKIWLLFI